MNENEIRQAIHFLEKDKQDLERQIEQLNLLIDRYKTQLLKYHFNLQATKGNATSLFPNETDSLIEKKEEAPKREVIVDPSFPYEESIDDQLIYLLEKTGRSIRLPDLQAQYNSILGEQSRNIVNVARRMKSEGKLVAAKFNNANTLTFWGIPEWVKKDENGRLTYIEENRPSRKDLPSGYNTIEFLE